MNIRAVLSKRHLCETAACPLLPRLLLPLPALESSVRCWGVTWWRWTGRCLRALLALLALPLGRSHYLNPQKNSCLVWLSYTSPLFCQVVMEV